MPINSKNSSKDSSKDIEEFRATQKEKFILIAGNVSLDFINTEIIENGVLKDLLSTYTDLAAWAVASNLMDQSIADEIFAKSKGQKESDELLASAKSFRKLLRAMFDRLAQGEKAGETAIAVINAELSKFSSTTHIYQTKKGYRRSARTNFREPGQLLALIADYAVDLLCAGKLAYLKKCESEQCQLYFYDTSKNHRRRWCSTKSCGNRAKATAFYERKKLLKSAIK
jgi:predicted RNA-binding Zn ribbon-like protein